VKKPPLDFIGVGFPRSGTTWLHEVMKAHPDIYVPTLRKELNFFKGQANLDWDWYRSFFDNVDSEQYKSVGEISTAYIRNLDRIIQIKENYPNIKIIICLRNPVDRMYSNYKFEKRRGNKISSFENYFQDSLKNKDWTVDYSKRMKSIREVFDSKNIITLILEDDIIKPHNGYKILSDHLNLDRNKFPLNVGVVNASYEPRFRLINLAARKCARFLRKNNMDRLKKKLVFLRNLPLLNRFKQKQGQSLTTIERDCYIERLNIDWEELELVVGRSLSCWHPNNSAER